MARQFIIIGAIFGFLGVGLGAFGAHLLKQKLPPDLFDIFEVGVRYHMYHALAIIAVGLAAAQWPGGTIGLAGWAFTAGIVIFSGSLYVLALTGTRWLGAITPLGGVAFLVGWGMLAYHASKLKM
jgi:uncharacterized membrane protein YgdD (TMEM256/DUF423 family)